MIKFRDFEKKEARKQSSQQEKQGFKTADKLGDSDLSRKSNVSKPVRAVLKS